MQSTHWLAVLSDPYGLLPALLRDVNRGLAHFIKAHRGWRGAVFQAHPNVVQLLTSAAIVDKIGYTLANPVAAGAAVRELRAFRAAYRTAVRGVATGDARRSVPVRHVVDARGAWRPMSAGAVVTVIEVGRSALRFSPRCRAWDATSRCVLC